MGRAADRRSVSGEAPESALPVRDLTMRSERTHVQARAFAALLGPDSACTRSPDGPYLTDRRDQLAAGPTVARSGRPFLGVGQGYS